MLRPLFGESGTLEEVVASARAEVAGGMAHTARGFRLTGIIIAVLILIVVLIIIIAG